MSEMTRVGADLAKRVIQVHGVDAAGKLVTNRQLARDKFIAWCAQLPNGCLIAMQASYSTACLPSITSIGWVCRGSHDLNVSNRPVRTGMPGGVAGAQPIMAAPYADCRLPPISCRSQHALQLSIIAV